MDRRSSTWLSRMGPVSTRALRATRLTPGPKAAASALQCAEEAPSTPPSPLVYPAKARAQAVCARLSSGSIKTSPTSSNLEGKPRPPLCKADSTSAPPPDGRRLRKYARAFRSPPPPFRAAGAALGAGLAMTTGNTPLPTRTASSIRWERPSRGPRAATYV